jgi:hypothetical protein
LSFIAIPLKTFRGFIKNLMVIFKRQQTDNELLVKELIKLAAI